MQIQNPMMFVRSLKGAPSSMLWVLIIVRQALTVNQLCAYTGYKAEAVRDAARVLQGYELVVENKRAHGEATYSIGQGYQFLLPGIDLAGLARVGAMADPESDLNQLWQQPLENNQSVGENQNPIKTDSAEISATVIQPDAIQSPIKTNSAAEIDENSAQNRIKTDSETGSIKILIDDDESYLKTDSSSSILNPKRKFPTLETVLSNLDVIFDDELHAADVPANTSPELALAWASKLYKDKYIDRRKLDNPIGILITRLRSGARRKMHLEFLPDEYLTAVGLWQKRCVFCDADFTSKDDFDAHMLDGHEQDEPDPDAVQVFEPTQPDDELAEPRRVWGLALDQLKPEVGRAAFESWLQNTVVVEFEQGVLQVGTNRKYAQDWLTKRATELAGQIVSEIMGSSVSIKFVLADV